jgi:hypothetical protein
MVIDEDSFLFAIFDALQSLWDNKNTRVEVGAYSFSISPSARRKIIGQSSLVNAGPPLQNLVPSLFPVFGYEIRDREGNLFAKYSGDSFNIGFYELSQRANAVAFNLGGTSISVTKDTLSRLNGKTLVMKFVEDGSPDPKSRKNRIMVAE